MIYKEVQKLRAYIFCESGLNSQDFQRMKSEQPDYWNMKLNIIIMRIHHFCLLTYPEWEHLEGEPWWASGIY